MAQNKTTPIDNPNFQWTHDGLGNVTGVVGNSGKVSYLQKAAPVDGFIPVAADFRLKMTGTGAVSIDTVDSNGTIVLNAFVYSLPTDIVVSNIKEFKAETVVGIKITAAATATVTYLG
jgi:hypothetical protein